MKKRLPEYAALCNANPIFKARLVDVGHLDLAGCLALGLTGPLLRATGYAWDLRKSQPYCGYEDYDFDVCTWDTADAYGRFRIRLDEMWESLRIVEQCVDRLARHRGRARSWSPTRRSPGPPARDRQRRHGQQPRPHQAHHGRVDGGPDPPLQARHRGLPGPGRPGLRADRVARAASSAPTSSPTAAPARSARTSATRRSPTCRRTSVMSEGGMVADVIVAIASIDPVMGGVDR